MRETAALVRKEINSYFGSAIALIFIGVFSLGALLTFFYVEGFWARNLADLRPLFRWLPILLIFLASALTMRQWSEEEQSGTLEMLLILPVRLVQLVLAKFFSVLALIAVALALTLILPVIVSTLGDLDLGPVVGGYVAALLLAAMYVSIGLFISSRTDNQLVALILSVLANGAFYLAGSTVVTQAVSSDVAAWLRVIGSGARFDSIERGVLDLRDLAYFVTITVSFLALNVISLDSRRWGHGMATAGYRFNLSTGITLIVVNALLVNVWLFPLQTARVDLTENQLYSLSDVTRETLQDLPEPLLIRAYISQETIPQIEPLIPQLEDTLREYEVAGDGNVTVEIVDPADDPNAETEATEVYGIVPNAQPVTDRFETSLVNFYFDVLLVYGDQTTVLSAGEMVEVDRFGSSSFELRFANLEYDLTSSIRSLVSGFQSIDAVLANLAQPAQFTVYYTPDSLPEEYAEVPALLQTIADDLNATGNFSYTAYDVNDPDSPETPQSLAERYQIQPFATDFFGTQTFYLHGVLVADGKLAVIRLAPATTEPDLRELIEGTLKRFSGGFLPVIGVWAPPAQSVDQFGQTVPTAQSYRQIQSVLAEDYEWRTVDLTTGSVGGDIDLLFLLNPQNMTQIERYAVDQYLMLGGTVFVTTSSYQFGVDLATQWLNILPVEAGVADMLNFYGVNIDSRTVMDLQNLQIIDLVNGQQITHASPHFADVRRDGLSDDNLITRGLDAVTVPIPSSLVVSAPEGVQVERIIHTSEESWDSFNTSLQPPRNGTYPIDGDEGRKTVGVVLTGQFTSYFAQPDGAAIDPAAPNAIPAGVVQPLTQSPDDTRLIVIGSAEFLSDYAAGITVEDRFSFTVQFVQNVVDWALSDTDLLEIRSADTELRLLEPIDEDQQRDTEIAAYGVTIFVLVVLAGTWRFFRNGERPMPLVYADDEDIADAA